MLQADEKKEKPSDDLDDILNKAKEDPNTEDEITGSNECVADYNNRTKELGKKEVRGENEAPY